MTSVIDAERLKIQKKSLRDRNGGGVREGKGWGGQGANKKPKGNNILGVKREMRKGSGPFFFVCFAGV